jgi:hypothetical protein
MFMLFCVALLLAPATAAGDSSRLTLRVAEPFIDMHTGPGRGYPVFHIAERDEHIVVLGQRTDWYRVRAPRGEEGWVHRTALERTLLPNGEFWVAPGYALDSLAGRRWEAGTLYGDFGGANIVGAYSAAHVTPNISVELWLSQVFGRFSNARLAHLNVVHTLYPTWRASPFFTLGGGVIHTEPKATLVAAEDRRDATAHVGFGVRAYLTRRFLFRAEHKRHIVFTSRDSNEEVDEWKAGFSFFF